jgi:integrase
MPIKPYNNIYTNTLSSHDRRAMTAAWVRISLSNDMNVHGLRKLAAAELPDAGCGMHEIAATTGHQSISMVQLYPRSAGQERLATAAIARLSERDCQWANNRKNRP